MQISQGISGMAPEEALRVPAVPEDLGSEVVEVVYDWDLGTDEISWGPNYDQIDGLPSVELVSTGLGFAEHLAPESPSSRYEAVMGPGGCDTGGGVSFAVVYGIVEGKRSKAPPVWIEDTGRWFADANDRPCRVHGVIRVITERFEAERRRTVEAQVDAMTGAFTRSHFIDHVTRHLSLAARKTSVFAVILIGIEHVGSGEPVADSRIAEAVARLRSQMRSHEILARYASAKFAALLEGCCEEQAGAAAARLMATVAEALL